MLSHLYIQGCREVFASQALSFVTLPCSALSSTTCTVAQTFLYAFFIPWQDPLLLYCEGSQYLLFTSGGCILLLLHGLYNWGKVWKCQLWTWLTWKKNWNVLEKLIIDLSKPLREKLPQPFSHQNVLISLIASQLSKSYISAAELVQDYIFFPRISYPMNIKSVFLVVEAGKAEDVVNLMLQILSSLIAYKETLQDTGWYPVFPVVNFAVQGVGTLPVRRVDCLLFRWFLLLLMVCLHS